MSAARLFPILLFLSLFPALLSSLSTESRMVLMPEIMGTGGAGVASYDRPGMILLNPASYANPDYGKLFILGLGLSAQPDLLAVVNGLTGTNGFSQTPEEYLQVIGKYTGLGVSGPLLLGYVGKSIGVLIYSQADVRGMVKPDTGLPQAELKAVIDSGILGGYGTEMPLSFGPFQKLALGFDFRFIYRIKYQRDALSLAELTDTLGNLFPPRDIDFSVGQAIGSDVGLLWKGEQFAAGLTVRDWFFTTFTWVGSRVGTVVTNGATNVTLVTNGTIPADTWYAPSVDFGISYRIPYLFSRFMLSDITFYLDYVNIIDVNTHPLLKVRLGLEALSLGFIRLGTGLYQGYPTAALGLEFPFMRVTAAWYTEEDGPYPGARPLSHADLSIRFEI